MSRGNLAPQALLLPLSPFYGAVVGAKNYAYDHGWRKPQRLAWPVVSVGNLSVGGSGKTPIVIRLAQLLTQRDRAVDVLSRGYGRSSHGVERVDPDGSAEEFGDEPVLIARSAGVPVYVGASRYEAGLRAEEELRAGTRLHLLDDGFQHRRLARDLDVVVIHASDFVERLLPAGRLREPLSTLKRASAIVLRAEDRHLEQELRSLDVRAPVWIQHRRLVVEPSRNAIAFCGIARPEEFFSSLRANGVELAATMSYADHHTYTDADVDRLLVLRQEHRAEGFVTTEKDAARMSPQHRAKLDPFMMARLEVVFENETAITDQLLQLSMRK